MVGPRDFILGPGGDNLRRMKRAIILLALLLAGCGGAKTRASTAAPAPKARAAKGGIPADFATRECAIYQSMDPRVRACTIRVNGQAGLKWLEVVSGKPAGDKSATERAGLIQAALSAAKKLTESELADAGWLVAEMLRQRQGGRYGWDAASGQVVLQLGPRGRQGRVLPMDLIHGVFVDGGGLSGLEDQLDADPRKDRQSCSGIRPVDVLRYRLTRK